jgi:hypothetical protein
LPGNSILLEEISSRFLCAAVKASLKLTTRLLSKPFVRQVYDYLKKIHVLPKPIKVDWSPKPIPVEIPAKREEVKKNANG